MAKKQILFIYLFIISYSLYAGNDALKIVNDDKMTEEEVKKDETYIHQGLADEKVKELCLNGQSGYSNICTEEDNGFKPGSMFEKLEAMIPYVNMAMSTIASKSGFTAHIHDDKGAPQYVNDKGVSVKEGTEGAKPKTENKQDYCAMVAGISEGASQIFAKTKNDVSEENFKSAKPEAKQAASFRALADSHKNLSTASKIQFGVWTAVAGCYVAYAAQAQFQGDTMVYVKLGWATFMATFYKLKSDAHKKRAKILSEMANKLPQAGECSPYSDRSCFCSEETSFKTDQSNFNKYCVPQELVDRNQNNDAAICADKDGKPDKECKCKKTNICIDRVLKVAGVNLGLEPTKLRDPLATLKPLSKGYGTNDIDSAAKRNYAIAKKTLAQFNPGSNVKLNSKQKEVAKALIKNGIPKAAAIVAAGNSKPSSDSSLGQSIAGISPRGFNFPKKSSLHNNQVNSAHFQKGHTSRTNRGSSNPYGRFGKKRQSSTKAVHIEEFADKATKEAEINKDTEKGIFDIISYRYKMKTLQNSFK